MSTKYILIRILRKGDKKGVVELCEVSYDSSGRPERVLRPSFCGKSDFRVAAKEALANNAASAEGMRVGEEMMTKYTEDMVETFGVDVFWIWQELPSEEDLYAVYGGD